MPSAEGPTIARATTVGATAALLAVVLVNVYCLASTWHPAPYWDHWETVEDYRQFLAHGIDWRRLVAQHNEHRIVFSNLLALADYRFFAGMGLSLVAVNVLFSCATVYLVCRVSGATRLGAPRRITALFCVAAGTSVAQIGNVGWAFQTAWFLAAFLPAAALATHLRIAGRPGAAATGWAAASWALAAAATFSSANGMMTWPALLLLGAIARHPRRHRVGTLAFGVLSAALYLSGYQRPGHHPPLSAALRHPAAALGFVAAYATNAFQFIGTTGQFIVGGALVLCVGVELLVALQRHAHPVSPERAFLIAFSAFLLGTIAMTAAGRVALGGAVYANSGRYVTYGLLLSLTVGLLVLSRATTPGRRASVLPGAMAIFAIALTVTGLAHGPYAEAVAQKRARVGAVLCDEVAACPDATLSEVYPNPGVVRARVEFLREQRLAQFAPAVARGSLPSGPLTVDDLARIPECIGEVDKVERTPDGLVVMSGWMIDSVAEATRPDRVVTYSESGLPIGGGGVCELRMDVQRKLRVPLRNVFMRDFGFRTWTRNPAAPLYAVGFFHGERRCLLPVRGPGLSATSR